MISFGRTRTAVDVAYEAFRIRPVRSGPIRAGLFPLTHGSNPRRAEPPPDVGQGPKGRALNLRKEARAAAAEKNEKSTASTCPPMPAMPRSLWWPIAARLLVDQHWTGLRGPLNRVAGGENSLHRTRRITPHPARLDYGAPSVNSWLSHFLVHESRDSHTRRPKGRLRKCRQTCQRPLSRQSARRVLVPFLD